MITVETTKFKQQIDAFVEKAKGRTREFAVEFIQDLNEAVVEATPVGVTGFLRASWHASLNQPETGDGGVAQMNLTGASLQLGDIFYARNGASYAWYVEFGTAAHEIVPVRRMALHWVDGGHDIFAKKVNHPGTSPQPYVRGTLARSSAIADAAAQRVAARR